MTRSSSSSLRNVCRRTPSRTSSRVSVAAEPSCPAIDRASSSACARRAGSGSAQPVSKRRRGRSRRAEAGAARQSTTVSGRSAPHRPNSMLSSSIVAVDQTLRHRRPVRRHPGTRRSSRRRTGRRGSRVAARCGFSMFPYSGIQLGKQRLAYRCFAVQPRDACQGGVVGGGAVQVLPVPRPPAARARPRRLRSRCRPPRARRRRAQCERPRGRIG